MTDSDDPSGRLRSVTDWGFFWESLLAGLERAYDRTIADLRIAYGPGQCAPAIGVHRGCEHDA